MLDVQSKSLLKETTKASLENLGRQVLGGVKSDGQVSRSPPIVIVFTHLFDSFAPKGFASTCFNMFQYPKGFVLLVGNDVQHLPTSQYSDIT